MHRIPATIVTGFLGAGKTSMIRHLLGRLDGSRRIALLINEFGDLGVDREIVLGCGDAACRPGDIVELANGCICCSVADEFLPVMQILLERADPPDHIMIETSGLALPQPLIKAFAWPEVRARVTVDGVIAVVDGPAFAAGQFAADPVAATRAAGPAPVHESPLADLFGDQMASADLVVLNKTDLLPPDTPAGPVTDRLRRAARPDVPVIATAHGQVDPAILIGLEAAAEADLAVRPGHHDGANGADDPNDPDDPDGHDHDDHDHDAFATVRIDLPAIPDPQALRQRLARLAAARGWLRVKGFLSVEGRPLRHVIQGVGARIDGYYDRPWTTQEDRRSELVIIGFAGLDQHEIRHCLDLAATP